MSTLSIPLTPELEKFVINQVKLGRAENKASVVRLALIQYERDEAVRGVLESHREALNGKILRGDLDELAKKIK